MDMEKVINGLEFTKAMITFNPSTGEDIEPENLNEVNKITYDACVGAIALLKERYAWIEQIADYQQSITGSGMHELTEYEQGKWDGLQIAWNIISEGR